MPRSAAIVAEEREGEGEGEGEGRERERQRERQRERGKGGREGRRRVAKASGSHIFISASAPLQFSRGAALQLHCDPVHNTSTSTEHLDLRPHHQEGRREREIPRSTHSTAWLVKLATAEP